MGDDRIKDMQDIQKVFNSFGVRLFLVYGALLGHYRDGDFLPGDDDVDFAVIDKIDLKTRKLIGRKLRELGFDFGLEPGKTIQFNVFGELEEIEKGYNGDGESGIIVCFRNFKFTIFFFKEEVCNQHGREYVCIPKLGAMKLISIPQTYFNRSGTIKIGKEKYLTPYPIEDYLNWAYFGNYKDKTDRRHSGLYTDQHA